MDVPRTWTDEEVIRRARESLRFEYGFKVGSPGMSPREAAHEHGLGVIRELPEWPGAVVGCCRGDYFVVVPGADDGSAPFACCVWDYALDVLRGVRRRF